MRQEPLRIGNAQGFWGDQPDAPAVLLQQQPNLDYLTLDYLSELSMSIMAIQREKDPQSGFAKDFIDVIRSLIPFWQQGSRVKVITNAGGLNPLGCAQACRQLLEAANCSSLKIGVVYGDDVLEHLKMNSNPLLYKNLDTQEQISSIRERLVTANAYFGAKPIVELLHSQADIVITGRMADPSLTVAPCVAHYGWTLDQYDLIAQATVAGHLIECGTQVTGGISTNWLSLKDKENIGFPFVEVEKEGSFVITKPQGTGGRVNSEIVKEQLLYEIGDPAAYLSPDAAVSFLELKLEEVGENRVRITGAKGSPPPATYKVSATYRDGWKTEAILSIRGFKAKDKARQCGEVILQRVQRAGYHLERSLIECLGEETECLLRIAAAGTRKEALEYFSKQIAPMVTSGPQGVTGYTSGRPHLREVFGFWPCLIKTSLAPYTLGEL